MYRLCVTSDSVMFFPVGSDSSVEFPHACIRCCAYNDRHFKLETGRNSPTGSGALLIDTHSQVGWISKKQLVVMVSVSVLCCLSVFLPTHKY